MTQVPIQNYDHDPVNDEDENSKQALWIILILVAVAAIIGTLWFLNREPEPEEDVTGVTTTEEPTTDVTVSPLPEETEEATEEVTETETVTEEVTEEVTENVPTLPVEETTEVVEPSESASEEPTLVVDREEFLGFVESILAAEHARGATWPTEVDELRLDGTELQVVIVPGEERGEGGETAVFEEMLDATPTYICAMPQEEAATVLSAVEGWLPDASEAFASESLEDLYTRCE